MPGNPDICRPHMSQAPAILMSLSTKARSRGRPHRTHTPSYALSPHTGRLLMLLSCLTAFAPISTEAGHIPRRQLHKILLSRNYLNLHCLLSMSFHSD